MSEAAIPDDPEDVKPMSMPGDELVEMWKAVRGELDSRGGRDDPELVDFAIDLWQSIRRRSETEEPKCPDCGTRHWGQAMGDPPTCRECGREGRADTEEALHEAWRAMEGEVRLQDGDGDE